jgi:hypothetical protein
MGRRRRIPYPGDNRLVVIDVAYHFVPPEGALQYLSVNSEYVSEYGAYLPGQAASDTTPVSIATGAGAATMPIINRQHLAILDPPALHVFDDHCDGRSPAPDQSVLPVKAHVEAFAFHPTFVMSERGEG